MGVRCPKGLLVFYWAASFSGNLAPSFSLVNVEKQYGQDGYPVPKKIGSERPNDSTLSKNSI